MTTTPTTWSGGGAQRILLDADRPVPAVKPQPEST